MFLGFYSAWFSYRGQMAHLMCTERAGKYFCDLSAAEPRIPEEAEASRSTQETIFKQALNARFQAEFN